MDQSSKVVSRDEFNDVKLVDQYIPLEDVYVESFYPFDTNVNSYMISNQQCHPITDINAYNNNLNMSKTYYEDFKENNNNLSYITNYNSYYNMTNSTMPSNYTNYSCEHLYDSGHGYSSSTPGYYNLTVPTKNEPHEMMTQTYERPIIEQSHVRDNFLEINENKLESGQLGEKPPEPYANIIVKAILSTRSNVMQLKDIYNYMIENYEYFGCQKQSTKWKNSVRHNLSRHKYFVKTCEKNAQGHYWSIDQAYLTIFKNGNFDEKSIKKAKLSSKLKAKAAKLSKKTKKQAIPIHNLPTSPYMSGNGFDMVSYNMASSSVTSSPTVSCKSFNSNSFNNDSGFMSNSEYANCSFSGYMQPEQIFLRQSGNKDDKLNRFVFDLSHDEQNLECKKAKR